VIADVATWTKHLALTHAERHGGSGDVDSAMDGQLRSPIYQNTDWRASSCRPLQQP